MSDVEAGPSVERYEPVAFWDQVATGVDLASFERWPDPSPDDQWAHLARGYAVTLGPVHAVFRMFWFPYPGWWRNRVELGVRHDAIEDVLDGFYHLHPVHTLAPWRLTFSGFVDRFGVDAGPTTIRTEADARALVSPVRAALERLHPLADECVDLDRLLPIMRAMAPLPEAVAACLDLLGRTDERDEYLTEQVRRARNEPTRERAETLRLWFATRGTQAIDRAP